VTEISDAENRRRSNFDRLVGKGYYPKRPAHTTMYAPSGTGTMTYVLLPGDVRLPLPTQGKFANIDSRTKLQEGPSG
jgi:hypothetical protein